MLERLKTKDQCCNVEHLFSSHLLQFPMMKWVKPMNGMVFT